MARYPNLGWGTKPVGGLLFNSAAFSPPIVASSNKYLGPLTAGIYGWGTAAQKNYAESGSLADAQLAGIKGGIAAAGLELGLPLAGEYLVKNVLPKVARKTAWLKFWDDIDDVELSKIWGYNNYDEVIEAEKLLNSNGEFSDSLLESRYNAYLNKKSIEGKTPKSRLEWNAWNEASPVARGNKFNKTARDLNTYDYYEVHLENGKRLDSYNLNPPEIISRKATDLNIIDEKTYRNYLS